MLDKAIAIAAVEFQGKYDKGGKPYILHCLHVMNKLKYQNDTDLMIAAILHDLVEDTSWTFNALKSEGFSDRVIILLKLLTHEKGLSYDEYIQGIASNKDAIRIKLQDLRHNSDIMRMKGLRDKDFERLNKYHRAYAYLESKLMAP